MKLVSIITPSFNQAAYLEQTILSVLNQDYSNIEYMVLDGASTDNSVDIIKKFENRLSYWVSEKDNGQADAINKGLDRAKGEIVAWLNSDDYYLAGTVSSAVKIFEEHPHVVLVYGNMLAVDEHGKTFNTLNYKQLTLEDLLCFQIIGQPAVFMRRSALNDIRLDPDLHFLLDHYLWIQIARRGNILHVNETLDESLAPVIGKINRRALASAHRVDARYLLDGGQSAGALSAWMRALFIHPPTALARWNIFVSAVLNLLWLGELREKVLKQRKIKYQK
ncbi:glycosyltransferase family 2 protein [Candidatus Villigracilis saccharophilus]|uniref:glycosyltransferase family 2 protein n=1 Tax=Candidatus Villigracilis saccharophilus TaxID=3140684 RepID=UPI0031347F72|nr:glycosyltransferase [Anaerolineales bacterium]